MTLSKSLQTSDYLFVFYISLAPRRARGKKAKQKTSWVRRAQRQRFTPVGGETISFCVVYHCVHTNVRDKPSLRKPVRIRTKKILGVCRGWPPPLSAPLPVVLDEMRTLSLSCWELAASRSTRGTYRVRSPRCQTSILIQPFRINRGTVCIHTTDGRSCVFRSDGVIATAHWRRQHELHFQTLACTLDCRIPLFDLSQPTDEQHVVVRSKIMFHIYIYDDLLLGCASPCL